MKNLIACTLTSDDRQARVARWQQLARRTGLEVAETPTGLRLTFAADAGPELEALAALERDCCAFADWTVSTADGALVLDIAAEGEAIPVAQAFFAGLRGLTAST